MEERIPVLKTYKLYIGGKFPRTESGRYFTVEGADGVLANACLASRKDFRNSVVAARKAQPVWWGRTAYNRSQILYRIAEEMEGRTAQFVQELTDLGQTPEAAKQEVHASIDRFIHYAGWADKFQQVFSSVNPVASSHFNFTVQEPTGVVVVVCPDTPSLLGLVSNLAPALVGGNACIVLASETQPLPAITLAEVLHASDVPGGVVNVLTGKRAELLPYMASHMDVNAVVAAAGTAEELTALKKEGASNVKRVILRANTDWATDTAQNPYLIQETTEAKTTWHPIEQPSGGGAGY